MLKVLSVKHNDKFITSGALITKMLVFFKISWFVYVADYFHLLPDICVFGCQGIVLPFFFSAGRMATIYTEKRTKIHMNQIFQILCAL